MLKESAAIIRLSFGGSPRASIADRRVYSCEGRYTCQLEGYQASTVAMRRKARAKVLSWAMDWS